MNTSLSSSNSVFGTVLAVVAVILSAIALYFGAAARNIQADLKVTIVNLDQRVSDVSSQAENVNNQLRNLEMTADRQFQAVAGRLQTIEARTAPPAGRDASHAAGATKDEGPKTEIVYKVRANDTIAKIAKKHGATADAILKANPGLDPRKLKIDQKVKVPVPAAAAKPATEQVQP